MSTPINGATNTNINPAGITGTAVSPQFQQKLLEAGVPQATIAQGRDAVHAYIDANPAVKQALEAEKQQGQPSIFNTQQQSPQVAQSGQKQQHKAQFEAKVQQYIQQNPGTSEQDAKTAVMAQLKAEHPQAGQKPMAGGCNPCHGCGGCGKKC